MVMSVLRIVNKENKRKLKENNHMILKKFAEVKENKISISCK